MPLRWRWRAHVRDTGTRVFRGPYPTPGGGAFSVPLIPRSPQGMPDQRLCCMDSSSAKPPFLTRQRKTLTGSPQTTRLPSGVPRPSPPCFWRSFRPHPNGPRTAANPLRRTFVKESNPPVALTRPVKDFGDVHPPLTGHCVSFHGPEKQKGRSSSRVGKNLRRACFSRSRARNPREARLIKLAKRRPSRPQRIRRNVRVAAAFWCI